MFNLFRAKTKAEIAMNKNQTLYVRVTVFLLAVHIAALSVWFFAPPSAHAQSSGSTTTTVTATEVQPLQGSGMSPSAVAAEVEKIGDAFASKSDRWMFIVAIIVLLAFGATVIYWALAQLDKQRAANTDLQKEFITYLRDNSTQHAAALQLNTEALKINNETNVRVSEAMRSLTQ